jgi:hypothetical protein
MVTSMCRLLPAIVCVTCCQPMAGRAGDDPARLVGKMFNDTKTLIESIDTFRCNYSYKTIMPDGRIVEGSASYVRRSDAEKCAAGAGSGQAFQVARSGALVRSLAIANGKAYAGTIRQYLGHELSQLDPWTAMGFRGLQQQIDKTNGRPAGRRYERYKAVPSDDIFGGRKGVVVEYTPPAPGGPIGSGETLEFDSAYNYLCTRIVKRSVVPSENLDVTGEKTLRNVKEVVPTVFLPTEVVLVGRDTASGKVRSTTTVLLSDIEVNRPVPAAAVALTFPKGIKVRDAVNRVEYDVGDDGKPAGPVRPAGQPIVP